MKSFHLKRREKDRSCHLGKVEREREGGGGGKEKVMVWKKNVREEKKYIHKDIETKK